MIPNLPKHPGGMGEPWAYHIINRHAPSTPTPCLPLPPAPYTNPFPYTNPCTSTPPHPNVTHPCTPLPLNVHGPPQPVDGLAVQTDALRSVLTEVGGVVWQVF